MTIAIGTLMVVAIVWPKGVGRWFAEIINAYEAARRVREGGKPMVDAPEKIWANGLGCYGTAGTDGTEYTRSDLVAELEAEVERLRNMVDGYGKLDAEAAVAERKAEALSRTGAVKVSREDVAKMVYEGMSWAAMCGPTPNGTVPVWEGRGNSLGQDEARRIADRILSALEPTPSEGHHHDDLAVDRFAAAMKAKLARKRDEGRGGWSDKEICSDEYLSRLLHEHVQKGDPLDVGNLAMMLHQRGERISPEGHQEPVAWASVKNHLPEVGSKFVLLYDDGSGASLYFRHDSGYIDADGDECDALDENRMWAYLPAGFDLWCEGACEPITLPKWKGPSNLRPSEQAVTEAMVEAFQEKYREFWKGSWPDSETSRELLKAAMEAGR